MTKTVEEILAPKPEARPRIYAYSIDDKAHKGLLKVGQTTRDVKQRVAQQLKTAAIKNYKIELDESAGRDDGTIFTDHHVRAALVKKGFANTELEWMQCSVADVRTVLTELRTGQLLTGTHHETFSMRREQAEAVNKTYAYYHSIWKEDRHTVPRFLWNAKMRFGKTFTTYQLAKKLGARRVLVVTFKPAVEDAYSLVSAYEHIVGVKLPYGGLANNLVPNHSYDLALTIVIATPQPVRDTAANLHAWKHVVQLRKVNEFHEAVITQHSITEVVQTLPA
jgi:hypothetical protein